MISIDVYRAKIGTFNPCSRSLRLGNGVNCCKYVDSVRSLYPFSMQFIVLYAIFILYTTIISLAMCVDINPIYINFRTPYIHKSVPSQNESLTITVRLYLALATCFVYKRLNILPNIFEKICPKNISCDINYINFLQCIIRTLPVYVSYIIIWLCHSIINGTCFMKNWIVNSLTIPKTNCQKPIPKPEYSYLSRVVNLLIARKTYNRLGLNLLLWLSILNLILVIVANPSITNPGPPCPPINQLRVAYQNTQGLIPFCSLGNPNPQLNCTNVSYSHLFISINLIY